MSVNNTDSRPGHRKALQIILYIVIGVLVLLQYPLWFGSGGLYAVWELQHEITVQQAENAKLRERNAVLEAEVSDLKQGYAAIEQRARAELGMVKKGETFYQVIQTPNETEKKPPRASR